MANNVEWKARLRDLERQTELARQLAESPPELLEQVDTFFNVAHGRLKLRRFSAAHGELIHYVRSDTTGPKHSAYSRVPTEEPDALRELLAQALGIRGEVRKRRWLYLAGPVRIHLDEVEHLGTFLEVEVVLHTEQSLAEGERIALAFRQSLDVNEDDLVECAYVDLLERKT
jgi:predicted adenylyl cyclase CyaB